MEEVHEPSPLQTLAAIVIATEASPGERATLAEESFAGGNLLRSVVTRLAPLAMVVAVVREEAAADLVDGVDNVVVLVDPEWAEGDSAPVRAGLDFLQQTAGIEGAFIVSCSMPGIDAAVLDAVARARLAGGSLVAVPKYRHARSGPVLLGRDIWPRFLGAEGPLDVEDILLAHPQWVTEARVDAAPPRRIITANDLAELS